MNTSDLGVLWKTLISGAVGAAYAATHDRNMLVWGAGLAAVGGVAAVLVASATTALQNAANASAVRQS